MDNLITISFIIPCHDLEEYISHLIESIHQLDFTNINPEFIFILDACTDNTEEVIEREMPPLTFTLYKCDFHSCGFARNVGLDYAHGKYIWFLDGDDWIINPKILQDCIPMMEEQNLDIIQIAYISNYFKITCHSMVWQYIFTKELIGDLRFRKLQPSEDVAFMYQIQEKRKTQMMQRYNIPSYYYNYMRPGSNMTQFSEKGFIE